MPICYIESFPSGGFCGEECIIVSKELATRPGWTVRAVNRELPSIAGLTRTDLVVGSPEFVRRAIEQLGVACPSPPDYPAALRPYLCRTVATSTLGEVAAAFEAAPTQALFVKPARDAKAFCGMLLSGADEAGMWLGMWLESFGAAFPVHTSTPINFIVEHRVFVVRGQVVGIGHYGRAAPEGCPPLDMAVVSAALAALQAAPEQDLAGCAIDFGVALQPDGSHVTALVECNDGVFTGFYDGVTPAHFVDMILARWQQIMGTAATPAAAPSASSGAAASQ